MATYDFAAAVNYYKKIMAHIKEDYLLKDMVQTFDELITKKILTEFLIPFEKVSIVKMGKIF